MPLRMRKGFQPVASSNNTYSLRQRAHRSVSHESVEPNIPLNTGGAQDLYPALGWRCLVQYSHGTHPCKTHRRTTTVKKPSTTAMFHIEPTSLSNPLLL